MVCARPLSSLQFSRSHSVNLIETCGTNRLRTVGISAMSKRTWPEGHALYSVHRLFRFWNRIRILA